MDLSWKQAFAYAMVLVALAASTIARVTTEASATPAPATTVRVPVCKYEDATRFCYWDATKHGNRKGRSFLSLPGGGRLYVDKVVD